MSRLLQTVRIGNTLLQLRKSSQSFVALRPDTSMLTLLRKNDSVRDIHYLGESSFRIQVNRNVDSILAKVRESGVAHHSYIYDGESGETAYFTVTDRINIRVDNKIKAYEIAHKFHLVNPSELGEGLFQFTLSSRTRCNPLKLQARIEERSEVIYAEPEPFIQIQRCSSKLEPQWHLNGDPTNHISHVNINAAKAWKIEKGSSNITLAILDDGFELKHPDLIEGIVHPSDFAAYADIPPSPSEDLLPLDEKPYPVREVGDYHGTPCAGLAIGRGKKYISGVAPGCAWMPVRTRFGFIAQNTTLRIFQYLSKYADVVSCSWGAQQTPLSVPSAAAIEIFEKLTTSGGKNGKGLVICFAAGNQNLPTHLSAEKNLRGMEYYDEQGQRLGTFFRNRPIHSFWPELPGVIVVGSISSKGRKSLYSSWGPNLTVVAPSDNYHPSGISTRSNFEDRTLTTADNEYHGRGLAEVGVAHKEYGLFTTEMGGTSGATPQVAGVCALIKSVNPSFSAAEVVSILQDSADKASIDRTLDNNDLHNNKEQTGAFNADGHSEWFGYGLVDANSAVSLAKKRTNMRGS